MYGNISCRSRRRTLIHIVLCVKSLWLAMLAVLSSLASLLSLSLTHTLPPFSTVPKRVWKCRPLQPDKPATLQANQPSKLLSTTVYWPVHISHGTHTPTNKFSVGFSILWRISVMFTLPQQTDKRCLKIFSRGKTNPELTVDWLTLRQFRGTVILFKSHCYIFITFTNKWKVINTWDIQYFGHWKKNWQPIYTQTSKSKLLHTVIWRKF